MADQKISELTVIESCTTEDYFPIVDYSASATRRIKPKAFMMSGVTTLKFATSGVSRDVLPMVDVSGATISKITLWNLLFGSLLRKGDVLLPKNQSGITVTFSSAFPGTNYYVMTGIKVTSGGTYPTPRAVTTTNYNTDKMWVSVTPYSTVKDVTVNYLAVYNG